MQQAIIDGMTKYAEQKFGRKRAAPKASKGGRSAMDDYDIYLRSLRSKVKTSQDKLNVVNKQRKVCCMLPWPLQLAQDFRFSAKIPSFTLQSLSVDHERI